MPQPLAPSISSPAVLVVRSAAAFRLLAARSFAAGATILGIEGVTVAAPTRHSVQVGRDTHVEMPVDTGLLDELDRYVWRFLNHSCAPNAALVGRELRAAVDIAPFDEITFDYLTTEFELAAPFRCGCGAAHCVGEVRGFAALTPAARARLVPRAAAHVLELARQHGLC
jgi:hypothetical protein